MAKGFLIDRIRMNKNAVQGDNLKVAEFYEYSSYCKMKLATLYDTLKSKKSSCRDSDSKRSLANESKACDGKCTESVKGEGYTFLRKIQSLSCGWLQNKPIVSTLIVKGSQMGRFFVRLGSNTKKATEDRHLRVVPINYDPRRLL